MAKKEKESKEPISKEEQIFSWLEKEFGKGIIQTGTSFLEKTVRQVSVSPAFDIGMGPIIEGSWVEVSGPEKSGKSLLCLYAASRCQLPENGSRNVYYASAECRVHKRDIQGIGQMDPNKLFIIQSDENKVLSAQDHLRIAEQVLHNDPGCVYILDSQSALCDEKELTSDIGTEIRASGHKSFAQFIRKCGPVVPAKKSIVFVIVHIAPNITGYGGPREKENTAFKYQKDYHIRSIKAEDWEIDHKKVGLKTTWKTITTRTGFRNTEFESQVRFGVGIDEVYELAILINKYGMAIDGIEKSGSWFKFPGFQEGLSCQGEPQLYSLLMDSEPLLLWCKEKWNEFASKL